MTSHESAAEPVILVPAAGFIEGQARPEIPSVPVPKFHIGQTVWRVWFDTKVEALPCPDCLDTGKWKIVTPAGMEIETECHRCRRSWSDFPKPQRVVHTRHVQRLTVGSVRIDTHDVARPVSYMCVETGVGSGSVYYEDRLFESEEDADRFGDAKCATKQQATDASPEEIQRRLFSGLSIPAFYENRAAHAGRRLSYLIQDITSSLESLGDEPDNFDLRMFRDDVRSAVDRATAALKPAETV